MAAGWAPSAAQCVEERSFMPLREETVTNEWCCVVFSVGRCRSLPLCIVLVWLPERFVCVPQPTPPTKPPTISSLPGGFVTKQVRPRWVIRSVSVFYRSFSSRRLFIPWLIACTYLKSLLVFRLLWIAVWMDYCTHCLTCFWITHLRHPAIVKSTTDSTDLVIFPLYPLF